MLNLLTWLATTVGIVTGFIALAEFMSKRINAAPQTQRRWIAGICIVITVSMFIFAVFFSHLATASATHNSSTSTVTPTLSTSNGYNTFTSNRTPTAPAPTPTPKPSTSPTPLTATPTATTSPTPTPIAAPSSPGTLVYKADWSGGMDGWSGGTEWKTAQNMLLSDGSNCCGGAESIVVAPINLSNIANYEIKARIQFIRADNLCSGYSFGLMLRMDNSLNGYEGSGNLANGACDLAQGQAALHVDNYTELGHASFVPGTGWHTYDVTVQGDQITLSIDGNQILTATDNTYIGGGKVGIEDFNVQMNISDFEVTAL